MKKRIKKILCYLPPFFLDYFDWIFCDASENQIRISKFKKNKFTSYTQLKKHQRRLKMFVGGFFLALLFLFIGLIVGPILSPQQLEAELYIPNGRGDIMLGNISKNQATIVFKTLDSANNNKPLATKALVEVFADSEYAKLVRRSNEDDYAITHIIPLDSLQENNTYYVRIIAKDAAIPSHSKTVSSWGDGKDPIKFYTAGELISTCIPSREAPVGTIENEKNELDEEVQVVTNASLSDVKSDQNSDEIINEQQLDDLSVHIFNVMGENYLQPRNKVQTIISWNTDKAANSVLIYGEGNSGEKKEIIINNEPQKKHAAVLTTLKTGTTYYFKVKSIDEDGNAAVSEEHSLRTPKPQATVVEKIAESFKSIFQEVKPN